MLPTGWRPKHRSGDGSRSMSRLPGHLLAILAIGACASDVPDGTSLGSTFRIDRIDRAVDGAPYFLHGTLGVAAPIRDLRDVDAVMATLLPELGRAIGVPADQLVARKIE